MTAFCSSVCNCELVSQCLPFPGISQLPCLLDGSKDCWDYMAATRIGGFLRSFKPGSVNFQCLPLVVMVLLM